MDCCPVIKGNNLRKLITKTLLKPFKEDIISTTMPTQCASGDPAGGSQLVYGVQLLMESNPNFCIVRLVLEVEKS